MESSTDITIETGTMGNRQWYKAYLLGKPNGPQGLSVFSLSQAVNRLFDEIARKTQPETEEGTNG